MARLDSCGGDGSLFDCQCRWHALDSASDCDTGNGILDGCEADQMEMVCPTIATTTTTTMGLKTDVMWIQLSRLTLTLFNGL